VRSIDLVFLSLLRRPPITTLFPTRRSSDLARHEHRHAVITACSAAEVALSESAAELLTRAGRTANEISDILDGVAGVVELYRLRSEEHTSELQSQSNLVCRLLLEKKNNNID